MEVMGKLYSRFLVLHNPLALITETQRVAKK